MGSAKPVLRVGIEAPLRGTVREAVGFWVPAKH